MPVVEPTKLDDDSKLADAFLVQMMLEMVFADSEIAARSFEWMQVVF